MHSEFRDERGWRCPTNACPCARARDLLSELDRLSSPPTGAITSASNQPESPSHSLSHGLLPNTSSRPDPLLSPSADSLSPAPAHVDLETVPFADPDSDIPMLALDHPPPIISSSEFEFEPPMAADSRAAFDHLPALENAHNED